MEEDPEDPYVPVRVFWNDYIQKWACHCLLYQLEGKCPHLMRYRKIIKLDVEEKYL